MGDLAKNLDDDARRIKQDRERHALSRAIESVFFNVTKDLLSKQLKLAKEWLGQQEGELTYLKGLKHPEKSSRFRAFADQLEEVMDRLEQSYREKFRGVYNEGAARSAELAALALPVDFTYSSGTLSALQFIEREAAALVTHVTDTTIKNIRAEIAAGVADGETITEIGARVDSKLGGGLADRARNIAQTETNKALNFGIYDSWKQSGVVQKKGWSSSGDDLVRETHVDADGQVVDLDSPFQVGGSALMFPGDTSLGADVAEIAACRCSMTPILVGEEVTNE